MRGSPLCPHHEAPPGLAPPVSSSSALPPAPLVGSLVLVLDYSKLPYLWVCHLTHTSTRHPSQSSCPVSVTQSPFISFSAVTQNWILFSGGVELTSWEIDRETVETVSDFILGGSKITADGDWSHEIKRHLLLGRKVMTYSKS